MKRRNFIDQTGRAFLLGGLAVLAGLLVSRRQVVKDTGCIADFQCRNCRILTDCQLPEAETERRDGYER
jgi:hypothetical protein